MYRATYGVLTIIVALFFVYNNFISVQPILGFNVAVIIFIVVIGFYVYWYRTAKYFEFDSKGQVLIFMSKGILLSDYNNYREEKIEFPKHMLHRYKIKSALGTKKLNLYIKTKGGLKKITVDISLIGTKKTNLLKGSLDKVLKENKAINESRR